MRIRIDVHYHDEDRDVILAESLLRDVICFLDQLFTQGEEIMSVVSEATAKVKEGFARMGVSFDGIVSDIAALLQKIEDLQNSSGGITPEDQVLLDEIQAMAEDFAGKFETLDAQNPPVDPSVPA